MFKLLLLYRTPQDGQFFDEDHYHRIHLGTALEFVGRYGCRRLELGRAITDPPRPRQSGFYRSTELYFDTLEAARACVFSPEMLALNPDGRNYTNVATTSAFYENEEFDFDERGLLASASGPWADFFEDRIGKAGLGLPPDTWRTIPPRPGSPGPARQGKPGYHGSLVSAAQQRTVKTLLLYQTPGPGQFFDEDHYHRIHLATGLEFLGKYGCRRLEIGRAVPVPERAERPVEFFRYTNLYFDSLEAMLSGAPTPEMRELSKDEQNYHNVPQASGWFEREVFEFGPDGRLALVAGAWADAFEDRIGKAGLGLPPGSGPTISPR